MARSGLVLLAGLAIGGLAAGALAQGQVRMVDPGTGWRSSTFAGGAFRAVHVSGNNGEFGDPSAPAGSQSFLSFCLERGENISLGSTLYNTVISDRALSGGDDGGNDPAPGDPISPATALLYQTFREGGMIGTNGFRTVVNSAAETRSLQRAIWALENELPLSHSEIQNDDGAHASATSRAENFYNWAIANAGNSIGNVRVLQLWSLNGEHRQDQLTLIPLPPAAWAGLGSLAGVMAIGYVRRRKQLS